MIRDIGLQRTACREERKSGSREALCTLFLVGPWISTAYGLDRQPVLPLNLALEAASAALDACVAKGFHETVVIVDTDGVQRVALRGDASGVHSLDSAFRKAYTAASFGQSTAQLEALVAAAPDAAGLRNLDKVLLVGGGIPIKVNDVIIGAIGAAGAPGAGLDEACARAGLDRIVDRLK